MNNLIQNAVRHNVQGGSINIEVGNRSIVIENSGPAIESPESIFERFTRSDQSIGSIGLGLAIVKEIIYVSGCLLITSSNKTKTASPYKFNTLNALHVLETK
jgi:signal transduction histidine kinase